MGKASSKMYQSIQLPWSVSPSAKEAAYRSAGLVKTQGSVYMLPPTNDTLIQAFIAPPRQKTRNSAGAVALCKHFERGGASSERGKAHPFWPLPKGSNDNKDKLAAAVLEKMLADPAWRNMMLLHPGVAVYEIRNSLGYGMRWTLELEEIRPEDKRQQPASVSDKDIKPLLEVSDAEKEWITQKITFRGFLEPIIGMDHELPRTAGTSEDLQLSGGSTTQT